MLKRKIAQLQPPLSVWELDTEMPCSRFTHEGRCRKITTTALVCERTTSVDGAVFVVFPYCQLHLPAFGNLGGQQQEPQLPPPAGGARRRRRY